MRHAATEADAGTTVTGGANRGPAPLDEARLHYESGRFAESLRIVDSELRSRPGNPEALATRASTLYAWQRLHEALETAALAERKRAHSQELDTVVGWASLGLGRIDEAEARMRKAVAAAPGTWSTHANLAVVLQARGSLDEAAVSYARALELNGNDAQCLLNLGVCKVDQHDPAAGEALIRRAIVLDGGRARSWANLGVALALQGRHDAAFDAFDRANRISEAAGEHADHFVNFGLHLREAGRTLDALAHYEGHLPAQPDPIGQNDYAFALLTAGRLVEGWNQYEFRWMRAPLLQLRAGFNLPTWQGQDLRGRVILLRAEQGFGDIIQFVRYAPLVKTLGATVLLQVREGLERLAHSFAGIDEVLDRSKSEALPPFDFYAHLPSLPRSFGTALDSIPTDIPYLRLDSADLARWSRRLGEGRKITVGLAWAGSPTHTRDRFRSMQLSQLRRVLEVGGVRFVSLQKGAGAEQATDAVLAGVEWLDLGPELADFADTAAVIAQLDLVICVDTAVAHLAGALGKPVWVMLPEPADFRWLEGREDSPWYPTMRLFRQSRRDEWSDVVERVAAALQERVRNGAPPPEVKPKVEVAPTIALPWTSPAQLNAGHRAGMSAVAETRMGIMQYLPDEPIVGDAIGWYGEYLQPQLELLARIVRPGGTMLEAGAGVGEHALYLGRVLGEAGHLMLYEARPVQQRILRQNLAANGVGNVTVMRRMLGSRSEEEDVAASVPPSHETLDELQLERLDWLKVGASGDALDILAGASETLWRLRPFLFLAAGDEEALREQAERAREFGYRCWRMDTALFEAANFNRRETDIFAGAKALALLAIPEEIEVDVALDRCSEIS